MKAEVYKFFITYKWYENKIWREVEVSNNYKLSKLAYLILAAFDTQANHLFFIKHNETQYEFEFDSEDESIISPSEISLKSMNLECGSVLTMVYDFGCEHIFEITLTDISVMEKGASIKYPKITDGSGKGILDNVFPDDFGEIIKEIDKTKKSEITYISPYGESEPWDYRDFDIDEMNRTLKRDIESVAAGFDE